MSQSVVEPFSWCNGWSVRYNELSTKSVKTLSNPKN
jgi:hypothetical protein